MKTSYHEVIFDFIKLIELLLVLVSFIFAAIITDGPLTLNIFWNQVFNNLSLFDGFRGVFILICWYITLHLSGMYKTYHFSSMLKRIEPVFKAVIICTIILCVAYQFNFFSNASNKLFIIFSLTNLIILSSFRFVVYSTQKFLRHRGRNLRFALIAGTGKRALNYARYFETSYHLGYSVKGFIDNSWHGENVDESRYPKIVCDFDNFSDYLRENIIDEIIICLPIKTCYKYISDIVTSAEEQGVMVRLSTDLFNLKLAHVKIENIDKNPLITLITGGMYKKRLLVKYVFDFVASLIIILLTSPIMLLAALSIKLTSKGPVFFLQPRIGVNKRIFQVIKFRTMAIDAEKRLVELSHLNERKDGAAFKIKDDPRVTPVGKFLRKYSIDELPQLINVLKGDMSIVGPRPLPLRDFKGFDKDWHRRRFSVKPGITCIWQVSGRDNIPFDKWMEMDMEYIDNWSLLLDLKILFKTIPVSLSGAGAS